MSSNILQVRNPRTGEPDYQVTPASAEEIAETCQQLRQSQREWSAMGLDARTEVLEQWATEVEKATSQIAAALTTDTGRRAISIGETASIPATIRRWCKSAPELLAEHEFEATTVPNVTLGNQLVPYALVGAISPWNFPLVLSLIDAIPALIAGCAVIIKPSEVTPRFAEPLAETIRAVPELAKVAEIVLGDGATGAALVDNVDAICFTGSVPTGQIVGQAAARNFIPAFLELGGNDPAIVLESADIDRATDALLRGSIINSGQACQSIERIYVARSSFDTFVEKLAAKANAVELSYPDIRKGILGPFIFGAQGEKVAAQLADAKEKGATIHSGGDVQNLDGGLYLKPTVMTGLTDDMTVMTDETFGPVLPVLPFDTVEEAIDLANDTEFGLSASVFAGTVEEAETVARQIDAGGISINDAAMTAFVHEAEKHSFKLSGLGGSRMGPSGLTRFLRKKALIKATGAPVPLAVIDEGMVP